MAQVNNQSDTRFIFDSLRRIVQGLRQSSKATEKEMGISSAQLFVLQKIFESKSPLSINNLADITLTHQSSVSVVVTKLVEKKLIKRVVSKMDSRAVALEMTLKGKLLLSRSHQTVQDRLRMGISQLSKSERKNLKNGLQKMIRHAGLHHEQPSLFFEEGNKKKYGIKTR